ncbi:MAG: DSD1 family PLP-dependent enzyme [Planctomycetaceae bacterium]
MMLTPATIAEIDTPALLVDLDALDANIRTVANNLASTGKQWRPHAKGHKSVWIAQQQLAAGAMGVTVAKPSEAEVFAAAGIRDILIAHCVVGPLKTARVARIAQHADPIVCCDHYVQAEGLSQACVAAGATCRLLIEVNIGLDRIGVRPGFDTRNLAHGIARLPGVRLAGVMGYEGHLLALSEPEEKRDRIRAAIGILIEARDQLISDGFECPIVSAGGTGSYEITGAVEGVTELQAGGAIFADPFYTEACSARHLQPSLALLSTVVSRPKLERAVLDCGHKSLSSAVYPPRVLGVAEGRPLPDATIGLVSAEHLNLDLGPRSLELHIGDKVLLHPGYHDLTTVLHDRLYGIRHGAVERLISLDTRGRLQ